LKICKTVVWCFWFKLGDVEMRVLSDDMKLGFERAILSVLLVLIAMPIIGIFNSWQWVKCRARHDEHDWIWQNTARPGRMGYVRRDLPKVCKRCSSKQRM